MNRRLKDAEEKALAREIRALEVRVREILSEIPEASEILAQKRRPSNRTHAADVDLMVQALGEAWGAARVTPALRPQVQQARAAWARAEELRWRLADSALYVARQFAKKISGPFLDEEDLFQEGRIGLYKAAVRFDPEREIKFPTYAKWWVRAQITKAVDSGGRPIRLTSAAVEQMRNIRRVQEQYESEQISYTTADLAADTGIAEDRVKLLLRSQQEIMSLDAQTPDGGGRPYAEVLSDQARPIDDVVTDKIAADQVREALRVLDKRSLFVLVRRFGLEDGESWKLSDVGKEIGLSRERVRQIEKRALQSLQEALS